MDCAVARRSRTFGDVGVVRAGALLFDVFELRLPVEDVAALLGFEAGVVAGTFEESFAREQRAEFGGGRLEAFDFAVAHPDGAPGEGYGPCRSAARAERDAPCCSVRGQLARICDR